MQCHTRGEVVDVAIAQFAADVRDEHALWNGAGARLQKIDETLNLPVAQPKILFSELLRPGRTMFEHQPPPRTRDEMRSVSPPCVRYSAATSDGAPALSSFCLRAKRIRSGDMGKQFSRAPVAS